MVVWLGSPEILGNKTISYIGIREEKEDIPFWNIWKYLENSFHSGNSPQDNTVGYSQVIETLFP